MYLCACSYLGIFFSTFKSSKFMVLVGLTTLTSRIVSVKLQTLLHPPDLAVTSSRPYCYVLQTLLISFLDLTATSRPCRYFQTLLLLLDLSVEVTLPPNLATTSKACYRLQSMPPPLETTTFSRACYLLLELTTCSRVCYSVSNLLPPLELVTASRPWQRVRV